MGKKLFTIELIASAVIELDDVVIEIVDDEWRETYYNLRTPNDIAEHIGYNLIINRARLSELDGWADQSDRNAKIVSSPNWEIDAYGP